MVTWKDLIDAYMATRSNKRRSGDSVRFELHWQANLLDLLESINNRTLNPTAYTFVTTRPRPREIFACDMSMRVIHHYIDIRLRPLLEARLTERTFNNRVGFGGDRAINTLVSDIYDVSAGFKRDAWIIKLDLSGYFPNANQDIICKQLTSVVTEDYDKEDKDDLLYMIQHAVHSYPQLHCKRKSPLWKWDIIPDEKSLFKKPLGVGGAIGHLIWQNAMNYYLNDLDHWMIETCGFHYIRFVDDMVIVTDNKEAFLSYTMPEIRRRVEALGCKLHPRKFYCQHYTKGVEFLGTVIKMDRVYAGHRTVRNAMATVQRRCTGRVRLSRIESFLQSANSHLGLFKNRNAYGIIRNYLDAIPAAWWKFIEFNGRTKTLKAREGFRHNELLAEKYGLILKKT